MLTVLSAMAQQESENISSHIKLGLQMKLKRGELILQKRGGVRGWGELSTEGVRAMWSAVRCSR